MTTDDALVRDVFITGLRNVHALEQEARRSLSNQVRRLAEYPVIRARIEQHLGDTDRQIGRITRLLHSHGADRHPAKVQSAAPAGTLPNMAQAPGDDEVLKNTYADAAFEAYECATYKSLITMAIALGETDAAEMLSESLAEEEAMAAWLDDNLADLTLDYLERRRAA